MQKSDALGQGCQRYDPEAGNSPSRLSGLQATDSGKGEQVHVVRCVWLKLSRKRKDIAKGREYEAGIIEWWEWQ